MHFDHLGIATHSIDEAIALFGPLLDAPVVHEESDDALRFVFLELANGYFELMEPLGENTPISTFLSTAGPGVHHVALRVEDIEASLDVAREAGIELVDEEPRPGAWGHEVAFLHPASTGGVLLEYVA